MKYDLEERTIKFSENIIILCKKIQKNTITLPLINQLIRSATSIGANYSEANGAASKKDFKSKIFLCKKESMETKYWLRLLAKADEIHAQQYRNYWIEVHELTLIFSKISKSSQ